MSVKDQQALDRLYAIDNVLTIEITMPQADWDAVRTEQPAGGPCNFDWTGDSRYTWRKATSVEISGTSFPAATTFTDVGVKKKSFCGSINSDKPCLHIDFGKIQRHHRLGGRRPDRVPLPDAQQLHPRSVLRSTATGLHPTRHGRAAALAMQLRSRAGERETDRPGRRRRQQPRRLRQRRTDHEALHRTELQRQPERQPVRARTPRRPHQREDPVHRRGITVQVRRQGRPETRRRPDRRARPGRREPDAGPRPVHQDLRDGVPPQALGRLFRQHQQHLPLQRRQRRRLTRPRQRQVQDDPLGHRPDPATPALLQDEHQRTDREAGPQRRHPPHAADQPDPDLSRHDLRPRGPAGPTHTADRPHGGAPRRLRCTQRRLANRGRAPTTPAGRLGRLPLRRTTGNAGRSTSSKTTPASACTPATPKGSRPGNRTR